MAFRRTQHGFISDSSTILPVASNKTNLERSGAMSQKISKMAFVYDGTSLHEGPRAMTVSETGEKLLINLDSDYAESKHPFITVDASMFNDTEKTTYPAMNLKKKRPKVKSRISHKKMTVYAGARSARRREQTCAIAPKIELASKATQTYERYINVNCTTGIKLENIGDVPKDRGTMGSPSRPKVHLKSFNKETFQHCAADNKFSFSEIKYLISVLTLITLVCWLLSVYFSIEFPADMFRWILKYFEYIRFWNKKIYQPKTKAEILMELLKSLFS